MLDLLQSRCRVNSKLEQYRQADAVARMEQACLDRVDQTLKDSLEAQRVIQTVAQAIQQKVHERIAAVVTRCLNAVFDDPYQFKIVFEKKRGKTEAVLTFIRDGMVLDNPLDEVGGGVTDVAALALRLACILLTRPVARRLLVLDEPFSKIRGEENRRRTRAMLVRLADEMGLQIILNTDIAEFSLGTVVEMG